MKTNIFRTGVFMTLIFASSFLGSIFLLFPFLVFMLLNRWTNVHRVVVDHIIGFWLTFPVALVKFLLCARTKLVGDSVRSERALIIMNHRTRLDWMFFWNALFRCNPSLLTTEKIILKAPLRKVPGAGWAMEFNSFIFLERLWEKDKQVFDDSLHYFAQVARNYQILLFPEGTDFCELTKSRSDSFAQLSHLPEYNFVLHPRTTGFLHIVQKMKSELYLDAVYDVTVAYTSTIAQTERDFAAGRIPSEIQFKIVRHAADTLPLDAEGLKEWCRMIWQQKEQALAHFYSQPETSRSFETSSGEQKQQMPSVDLASDSPSLTCVLWFSVAFWTLCVFLWIYLILFFRCIQAYCVVAIISCKFIEWKYGGIERLQMQTRFKSY